VGTRENITYNPFHSLMHPLAVIRRTLRVSAPNGVTQQSPIRCNMVLFQWEYEVHILLGKGDCRTPPRFQRDSVRNDSSGVIGNLEIIMKNLSSSYTNPRQSPARSNMVFFNDSRGRRSSLNGFPGISM